MKKILLKSRGANSDRASSRFMIRQQRQISRSGIRKLARRPEFSAMAHAAARRIAADDVLRLVDRAAAAVIMKLNFSHSVDDLAACETAARRVLLCSRTAGTVSGAATGIGGLPALPADMASSLLITAGTVHATASAFGFRNNSPMDQLIRLHAMDLAVKSAGPGRQDKKDAIGDLLRIVNVSAESPSTAAVQMLAQTVLPGVLDNLINWAVARAGGKAVPAVSAVTGGYFGYLLQTRAWKAAAYVYSERWHIERRALVNVVNNNKPGPASLRSS